MVTIIHEDETRTHATLINSGPVTIEGVWMSKRVELPWQLAPGESIEFREEAAKCKLLVREHHVSSLEYVLRSVV